MSIDEENHVDILVVDDGSVLKFNEDDLISNYKKGKIFFEYLNENQGIGMALNKGLEIIQKKRYEFVGRLDCGDYCLKNRFEKQLNYLNENPELKLLGSWANIVNENRDKMYELRHPTDYNEIRKKMYLNNMFVHPSVVFRANILKEVGFYPEKYRMASQDYAFFFKISKKFKVENYPELLVDYVISPKSISSTKRKLQVKNRIKIIIDNFYWGYYPIYGLLRNISLFFISRNVSVKLKEILKK